MQALPARRSYLCKLCRALNLDFLQCRQTLTGSPDGVVRLWYSEDVFTKAARALLRRGGAAASTADSAHSNDSCSKEVLQGARRGSSWAQM